jgi:hypothetical protein
MIIDTDTNCTKAAPFLVKRGVEVVGRRYAHSGGSKVIKKAEARALSSRGIRIFTVYKDVGSAGKFKLTADEGAKRGTTAKTHATAIGQPKGRVIYFAVEGLPHGYKKGDLPMRKTPLRGSLLQAYLHFCRLTI